MPDSLRHARAGGLRVADAYLQQSIGFILAACGWWFILWQWIPIYASLTVGSFVNPIARIIGWNSLSDWLITKNGVFISSIASSSWPRSWWPSA